MATLRSGKQVGGGCGGGGEVDGRDRGALQAADIEEKRNAWTSKVLFGSLILDLLGLKVVLPVSPAFLDCYSKHNTSGLYSSQLYCVTYYQHIIGVAARFHSVLFGVAMTGAMSVCVSVCLPRCYHDRPGEEKRRKEEEEEKMNEMESIIKERKQRKRQPFTSQETTRFF